MEERCGRRPCKILHNKMSVSTEEIGAHPPQSDSGQRKEFVVGVVGMPCSARNDISNLKTSKPQSESCTGDCPGMDTVSAVYTRMTLEGHSSEIANTP